MTAAQPSFQGEARHKREVAITPPLVFRLNVVEAKLGVSRSTVYRLIQAGRLVRVKLGARACGVTAASVHALIDAPAEPLV